ncbi:MAG TPA: helix-turn-helix transcriptional regulator [Bacillota bacterium]|nr:helix-turn-helix transcriptional regulator [Bacillota bacterium]HOK68923.1 helix-turn-helix transcriptional regulator [Bacillota bacterium]HPP85291.1 helix-turn-helix transcriptional regulator [Bacillota bacterium]
MFPKRLKELRGDKGLSQRELAKLLNISSSTIAMYETGQRDPDTETLQRLAEFFDCSIDYLLGKSNIREPADEIAEAVKDDPELADFWNVLREREDLKLLFKQTKKLEPREIKQIIRIIKAIEDEEGNT